MDNNIETLVAEYSTDENVEYTAALDVLSGEVDLYCGDDWIGHGYWSWSDRRIEIYVDSADLSDEVWWGLDEALEEVISDAIFGGDLSEAKALELGWVYTEQELESNAAVSAFADSAKLHPTVARAELIVCGFRVKEAEQAKPDGDDSQGDDLHG